GRHTQQENCQHYRGLHSILQRYVDLGGKGCIVLGSDGVRLSAAVAKPPAATAAPIPLVFLQSSGIKCQNHYVGNAIIAATRHDARNTFLYLMFFPPSK